MKYQTVLGSLLIFTIVASAIFILISILLATCNIGLKKNMYAQLIDLLYKRDYLVAST